MTILTAMQSAAVKLISSKPGTFFGSTEVIALELTDLINDVARDIMRFQDWQALTKFYTLPADGAQEDFELPADYSRMTNGAMIQQTQTWLWGYYHCQDLNQFISLKDRGWDAWPGIWMMFGGTINFYPAPPAAPESKFPYISDHYAVGADGVSKASFDSDTDQFLLPEELLMLGLVWRWRMNKGYPSEGDQDNFQTALSQYAVKDSGPKVFRSRRTTRWPGARWAFPQSLGGV